MPSFPHDMTSCVAYYNRIQRWCSEGYPWGIAPGELPPELLSRKLPLPRKYFPGIHEIYLGFKEGLVIYGIFWD